MTSITTYTKKTFDPLSPDIELIDIVDIAHALSLLCRANGHFPEFYSVETHSLNCMKEARARGYSARVQFACLLHDASEAYLSDVTRPVKSALPQYKEIETVLQNVIYTKWLGGVLSEEEHRLMREVDDVMLYYEMLHYFGEKISPEAPTLYSTPKFCFNGFEKAEKDFLDSFESLRKLI